MIWRPTGRPALVGAHGTLIAGSPARLAGSVYTSERYMESGSVDLSPSAKAAVGEVGQTIASTPSGLEAAKACGMSQGLMLRRIVMPSAFRRALPAYGNECVFMLHGSAVASTVTPVDLTGAANIVNSRYYSPYEAYSMAAVFYMALTFAIVGGFVLLERRMLRHLKPRSG